MNKLFKIALLDAATPWIVGFQDPATPVIIGIIHFYNHLIFFLVAIGVFVCWILYRALVLFTKTETHIKASKFTHSTPLEIVWTITPAFLLLLIAGPSFALLYSIDEVIAPYISLKVIGHQWYWSYEYSDYFNKKTGKTVRFDSYIIAEEDLTFGGLRLLEVDNRVKLHTIVHICVLVSAADVLHSWAVPSLGVKIDACFGRLNQVSVFLLRSGVFYGQCSEICGVNHGFIPIVVESLDKASYLSWAKFYLNEIEVPVSSRRLPACWEVMAPFWNVFSIDGSVPDVEFFIRMFEECDSYLNYKACTGGYNPKSGLRSGNIPEVGGETASPKGDTRGSV